MISFYPGPSKVHEQVKKYMHDAYDEGILSINHRSQEFISLNRFTNNLLRKKLSIPADYTIIYTSSATECWEIIAQSFIKKKSVHCYNGAFGKKWYEYSKKLKPEARAIEFDIEEVLDPSSMEIKREDELIAITQNETSNGTQVIDPLIYEIKKRNPECLVAVDATSSMGGIHLGFQNADIWFASVQKCFGLPAGMGILICSPQAMEVAKEIADNNHYNSFLFMAENAAKFQTHTTPNVLGIYLLMRVLKDNPKIDKTDKILKTRIHLLTTFFENKTEFSPLVDNLLVRSDTVLALKANPKTLGKLKAAAKKKGIKLGNGYGEWKESSFRIANFPAHSKHDFEKLIALFDAFEKG
tara:strand:+ start:930 stop:1994 length:1065 start_codon:yes stop_codon:yes gene_type:complete